MKIMGILKGLLDIVVFLVWVQFETAWRELKRAFPSTFGRRLRVVGIDHTETEGSNPSRRASIRFHVGRAQDEPDTITVDLNGEWLITCPSYALNDRGTGGCMDAAYWFGLLTGLVFSLLLWPVRIYYGWTEEYSNLDRNSRAVLSKLEGQIPAEIYPALVQGFISRRNRELGRG